MTDPHNNPARPDVAALREMLNVPFVFDPSRCNHMGEAAIDCPHCLRHKLMKMAERAAAAEWIACSERMPPIDERVQVWTRTKFHQFDYGRWYGADAGWSVNRGKEGVATPFVSHWRKIVGPGGEGEG